jgi:acyl-coenzyme A thioesterase PaaI-like protein
VTQWNDKHSQEQAEVNLPCEFDADTAVVQTGDGVFAAHMSAHWCARAGAPNGGYTLALCLRALMLSVAHPTPLDPLAVSATYLRPAAVGPAQIRARLLRSGRRLTMGEAALFQGGQQVVAVLASFADLSAFAGVTRVYNETPKLPPPEECVEQPPIPSMAGATLAQRMTYRWPHLPGWMMGSAGGTNQAEFWMRFRDGRAADALSLPTLVDAAAPVVLDQGERDSSTIELSVHIRAVPTSAWLACRAQTRHVMRGLHEEDFEIWDANGVLVAQSRQLAVLSSGPFSNTASTGP